MEKKRCIKTVQHYQLYSKCSTQLVSHSRTLTCLSQSGPQAIRLRTVDQAVVHLILGHTERIKMHFIIIVKA